MRLIFPSEIHEKKALAFRQAHFDHGETSIHGDAGLDKATSYEQWLRDIEANLTRSDGVFSPSATYFGVVNDEIVGIIDIRFTLNEHLRQFGGHIGYSVAPAKRRQGYASQMLQLALKLCKEHGIDEVLITADKDNLASIKTIVKAGGVFANEVVEPDGNIICRYWIML